MDKLERVQNEAKKNPKLSQMSKNGEKILGLFSLEKRLVGGFNNSH